MKNSCHNWQSSLEFTADQMAISSKTKNFSLVRVKQLKSKQKLILGIGTIGDLTY